MPRHRRGHAGRRERLPDSVHAGAHAGHPARRDVLDRQVGAAAGVLHRARYRGRFAARQPGHPHRDRRLHRQHRHRRGEHAAVAGPGGGGPGVSGEQGRGAGAHDRQGLRAVEPGGDQHDGRGTRAEPARRAAPAPVRERSLPMRRLITLGAALALSATPLAGQRTHSYEFSAFGAWTKYDKAFNLANKVGGGARFGYFFGEVVGIEADVVLQPDYAIGASATTEPLIGAASLIFNIPTGDRMALYVLGGYSRLDFGNTSPYHFVDGGIHGAVGDHVFLSQKLALRLEARMIYTSHTTASFASGAVTHIVGSVGISLFDHGGGKPPDSDKDGVVDRRGACPDTPAGAVVNPTECRVDPDHDGVFDGLDKCPNTPAGAAVNPAGCPADTDGDGVLDGIDKCPGTPAGTRVDANGCPPVTQDSDRDGVPNDRDKCPGTPAGTAVDQNGCMVLFREERAAPAPGVPAPGAPAPRPTLILQGVHFQTGRSVLTLDSYVVLDQVAGSLIANPEIRIEIAGYTDSTRSLAVNTRLSNARALAVQHYLARNGVRPDRMIPRGYQPASPVAPNATAAGRAQNRRVELHKLQ